MTPERTYHLAMNAPGLRQLFQRVRARPGMFTSHGDWSYGTAVAYVEGCFAASAGGELDRAFSKWLGEPSIAWDSVIVRRRLPGFAHEGGRYRDLTPEEDDVLLTDLFDGLDQFLATQEA
jgi:hypothetical protein